MAYYLGVRAMFDGLIQPKILGILFETLAVLLQSVILDAFTIQPPPLLLRVTVA
jgi:hypothetical protein